jgi:hypothetical protein
MESRVERTWRKCGQQHAAHDHQQRIPHRTRVHLWLSRFSINSTRTRAGRFSLGCCAPWIPPLACSSLPLVLASLLSLLSPSRLPLSAEVVATSFLLTGGFSASSFQPPPSIRYRITLDSFQSFRPKRWCWCRVKVVETREGSGTRTCPNWPTHWIQRAQVKARERERARAQAASGIESSCTRRQGGARGGTYLE